MLIVVGTARIEVEKPALAFPKTSGRFDGWLGYALMRRIWIDTKFHERFKEESQYRYSFEEELDALANLPAASRPARNGRRRPRRSAA